VTEPAGAALVTGGGARIGRAICLALASAGWDVAVHYHSTPGPAGTTAEAVRARGRRAAAVQADLADPHGPAALARAATEAVGPLTLLVNNASQFDDDRFGALEAKTWDAHFATNLRAPVLLAQAFAAALPADTPDGAAAVVNLLDQRVLKPNPQFFSYALSKSALWTATRMMAQALAPRVRVNGVGPGPTLASVHQDEAAFAREAAATPLGRPVTPEEIAAAVLYLVQAQAVTGQMIAVDSGQHLAWRTADLEET
jgi:NAD(P)-dependent dehydrogenase (short-subunit alcohol dehydrogenase family)